MNELKTLVTAVKLMDVLDEGIGEPKTFEIFIERIKILTCFIGSEITKNTGRDEKASMLLIDLVEKILRDGVMSFANNDHENINIDEILKNAKWEGAH